MTANSQPRWKIQTDPTPPIVAGTDDLNHNLLSLPDELLVLVVSQLHAIRLHQPQSQAFRNKRKEKNRQIENYRRRTALHALSLTCKTLNRIAVPGLYNAITGTTTRYGITPLRLAWKTLKEKQKFRYYVQYIENLLSDWLGNNLFDDVTAPWHVDLVCEYFKIFAEVTHMCANITQMSVVSIESSDFSFWRELFSSDFGSYRFPHLSENTLPKLTTLAFQTNAMEIYSTDNPSFLQILVSLLRSSSLRELRASGLVCGRPIEIPPGETFKNLRRIEITQCTLSHREVDEVISACESLRCFICHWSYMLSRFPSHEMDLFPSLSRHAWTLETLWLIADRAEFDLEDRTHLSCSSLRQLKSLKEAKVCNFVIPDKYCTGITASDWSPPPIAPELPPHLEHLTISYTMQWMDPDIWCHSVWQTLHRMAIDCACYLPLLRGLVIHFEDGIIGSTTGDDERLIRDFAEKGIRLSIVKELDVLASLI